MTSVDAAMMRDLSTGPRLWPLPPLHRELRWPMEHAALLRDPVWRGHGIPHGDGRAVLLICGFMAGDPSLTTMASWLKRIGYAPSRAGVRWNVGCTAATIDRLERRAEALVARTGGRIALVGQSRGGTCAKILAVRRPDLIERVVTLGSPLSDPFDIHPSVWASVKMVGVLGGLGVPGLLTEDCHVGDCCREVRDQLAAPIPIEVAFTSVWSRSDGVVRWQACHHEGADHVEVSGTHIGMAASAPVYRAVATALAA